MCVDALNEDRFGLSGTREVSDCGSKEKKRLYMSRRTWMFALQRVVILWILPAVTPGGFSASIDCRMVSSSATQDMAAMSEEDTAYFRQLQPGL